MARPGTSYTTREAAPSRTAPTDTGTLFIAGLAESGPTDEPVLIQNATDARTILGADIPESSLVADLEDAFRIGLRRAYVLTIVGPAAAGPDRDLDGVTDVQRTAALDKFTRRLGPGQVVLDGATTTAAHKAVIAHGAANNRTPFIDVPADDDPATLTAAVTALRSDNTVEEHLGAAFAGGVVVPGKVPGTTRTMSSAIAAAALVARQDAATGNPNAPAAGEAGRIDSGLRVAQRYTEAQRETLNTGGVNLFIDEDGVQLYGYRTLASRTDRPNHWMLSNVRLDMAVRAKADAIAKRHVFRIIDSEGEELAAYGGELTSMLGEYVALRAIYRKDDEGFVVDVGSGVNTPESIADGRIRAVLAYRRAPFGELVEVEHVVVGLNQGL